MGCKSTLVTFYAACWAVCRLLWVFRPCRAAPCLAGAPLACAAVPFLHCPRSPALPPVTGGCRLQDIHAAAPRRRVPHAPAPVRLSQLCAAGRPDRQPGRRSWCACKEAGFLWLLRGAACARLPHSNHLNVCSWLSQLQEAVVSGVVPLVPVPNPSGETVLWSSIPPTPDAKAAAAAAKDGSAAAPAAAGEGEGEEGRRRRRRRGAQSLTALTALGTVALYGSIRGGISLFHHARRKFLTQVGAARRCCRGSVGPVWVRRCLARGSTRQPPAPSPQPAAPCPPCPPAAARPGGVAERPGPHLVARLWLAAGHLPRRPADQARQRRAPGAGGVRGCWPPAPVAAVGLLVPRNAVLWPPKTHICTVHALPLPVAGRWMWRCGSPTGRRCWRACRPHCRSIPCAS